MVGETSVSGNISSRLLCDPKLGTGFVNCLHNHWLSLSISTEIDRAVNSKAAVSL